MTWSGTASRVAAVAGGGLLAALGGLAARYSWHQRRIERDWLAGIAPRLTRLARSTNCRSFRWSSAWRPALNSEARPGVSYLVQAGTTRLLFDTGLNARGVARPALVHNADTLHVNLQDLDGVVISHIHADHVGGPRTQLRRRLRFRPKRWSRAASRRTSRRTCDTNAQTSCSPRRHASLRKGLRSAAVTREHVLAGTARRTGARRQREGLRPGVGERLRPSWHRANARGDRTRS